MRGGRRSSQDADRTISRIGIKKGMIVADLGCGSGYYTIPISSRVGRSGTVYAVDRSSAALERLRANIKASKGDAGRIRILENDISDTKIPPGSVDIALFANVFHDIVDKPAFLNELKRILKPGGIAIDIDWQRVDTPYGPPFELRIDEENAKDILAGNGFSVISTFKAAPYHYALLLESNPHDSFKY